MLTTILVVHPVLPQQLPDLLRGDWDIDMAHAKMPERINDGVGNRWRGTDSRRLADALGPDRVVRRWRDRLADLPLWCLHGRWEQVVREGAGQVCPVRIVDDLLKQRRRQAHCEPALDLALNHKRV